MRFSGIFALIIFIQTLAGAVSVVSQPEYQPDSSTDASIRPGRLTAVLATQGALHVASLTGLYFLWYRDYPQSAFHFFNDNHEWLLMDKGGHAVAAAYISGIGYHSYRWAGVDKKRAAWFGGLLGFAYMLNIEILDGFSKEWGFSPGDLAANTAGVSLFVAQQLLWHEQRFTLKYSFHQTRYAGARPGVLGSNLISEMVKDYNGQTFWLSCNIKSFMPEKSRFPGWLNLAVGYGAEGMTGATGNFNADPQFPEHPYRKFFLSADIDFSRIPVRSPLLKTLLTLLNFIKIPSPAIEFNSNGKLLVHPLYY